MRQQREPKLLPAGRDAADQRPQFKRANYGTEQPSVQEDLLQREMQRLYSAMPPVSEEQEEVPSSEVSEDSEDGELVKRKRTPEQRGKSPKKKEEKKNGTATATATAKKKREDVPPALVKLESQDPGSLDSVGGSPSSRFVMTHEVASPAVPSGRITYQTPTRRYESRRYETSSGFGTVARPDHDECLRRTALVVHKHVTVCEQRDARRRLQNRQKVLGAPLVRTSSSSFFATTTTSSTTTRKKSSSGCGGFWSRSSQRWMASAFSTAKETTQTDTGRFRNAASRVFEESAYLLPRYEVVFAKNPYSWIGFHFSVERARTVFGSPSLADVYDFLVKLFNKAHLSSECSIVCLIYVERLMDKGKVSLLRNNWRPILLCSMLLASKVWQDCASWYVVLLTFLFKIYYRNIEFSVIFPQFTLAAINL